MEANTNKVVKEVLHRTFQEPIGCGERRMSVGSNAKGQTVVEFAFPAGEDIAPHFRRFDDVEAAREFWAKLQAEWKAAGWRQTETVIWQKFSNGAIREKKAA